jgi:hypothetical protein
MSTPGGTEDEWAALRGGLPEHAAEVMASHQGAPGTGVPAPDPDHGQADTVKYGNGPVPA